MLGEETKMKKFNVGNKKLIKCKYKWFGFVLFEKIHFGNLFVFNQLLATLSSHVSTHFLYCTQPFRAHQSLWYTVPVIQLPHFQPIVHFSEMLINCLYCSWRNVSGHSCDNRNSNSLWNALSILHIMEENRLF